MYQLIQPQLTREELQAVFRGIDHARVGLIGDLCLDVYWHADMRRSELSRETPHFPLPIVQERYSPGGAANVACNIAALQPKVLRVVSLIGNDWRGDLLIRALEERGIDCSSVFRMDSLTTNTYIKPLRCGLSNVVYEDPRIDFENRTPISAEQEAVLLDAVRRMAEETDVICVSDQMTYGVVTPAVRELLCALGKSGKTVIVDSRNNIADYQYVTVKPNEIEAARAFAPDTPQTLDSLAPLALKMADRNERLALLTVGENGCFVAENGTVTRCAAFEVPPPIDFCGAGDTFMSGFACALAGGAVPTRAAQVATLCSSVTIRKIGVTGTATREELFSLVR